MEQLDSIIQDETKVNDIENLQNKYDRIYKYSKVLLLIKSFDKIYDSIYGSQIRFFQRLNHTSVETKESLKLYYENATKNYPDAYKNYPYERYLGYLKANGLILFEDNDENVEISQLGKDFLRYILEANLSVEKMY